MRRVRLFCIPVPRFAELLGLPRRASRDGCVVILIWPLTGTPISIETPIDGWNDRRRRFKSAVRTRPSRQSSSILYSVPNGPLNRGLEPVSLCGSQSISPVTQAASM
jgi:hypothetical protein